MKCSVFPVAFCSWYCITLIFFDRHSWRAVLYGHAHQFYQRQVSYKAGESHQNCLTNRTWPISHHWLLIHWGRTHTHAYRRTNQSNFKKPRTCGIQPHVPGLRIFKCQIFIPSPLAFDELQCNIKSLILLEVIKEIATANTILMYYR